MEFNKLPLLGVLVAFFIWSAFVVVTLLIHDKLTRKRNKTVVKMNNLLIKAIGWLKRIARPYVFFWKMRKILPAITKKDVSQALDAWATLKANITGRVCGEVGDSLAQYLTIVEYVKRTSLKPIDSLEIGTLFGGSCLMSLFAIRNLGCSGVAICIDPMRGFITPFVKLKLDPRAKIPVNPETFYGNIRKFGFSEQDVKLITEMSDSPNIFGELKEKSCATLLIDGDHSYDGVKHDWEQYNKYVADGGFVLFDDYKGGKWPDVAKFVDQLIKLLPLGWKTCGTIGTTMILQRVGSNE